MSSGGHQESEGVDTQAVCVLGGQISKPPLLDEHDCPPQDAIN